MDGTSASQMAASGIAAGPRIRLRRSTQRRTALRLALAAGMTLVTVMAAASLVLPPEPAAALVRPGLPPTPAWVDIRRPFQLFDLAGTPFAKLPLAYAARRRTDAAARQDTLTFGAFGRAGGYLRFAVAWGDVGPVAGPDLIVDLARLASGDGLGVTRIGRAAGVPTRFGPASTAALELRRNDITRPCIGFRLETTGPARAVDLVGLACGAEAAELPCLIDRIDLASAGDAPDLRSFFVAAERRRGTACVGSRPLAAGL